MRYRAAMMVLALGLVAAACSAPTVTDTPEARPSSTGSVATSAAKAGIGDAITLAGIEDGLQMRVIVLGVVDPVQGPFPFLKPDKGNRFVGVKIRLENAGSVAYSDSPSNGAVVIDQADQAFSAELFDAATPGIGSPRIMPGDARVGYLTFQLPRGSSSATFQFTLNSGFGPETGQWSIA